MMCPPDGRPVSHGRKENLKTRPGQGLAFALRRVLLSGAAGVTLASLTSVLEFR